jgi:hypothetical protein
VIFLEGAVFRTAFPKKAKASRIILPTGLHLEWTGHQNRRQIVVWDKSNNQLAPNAGPI